MNNSPIYQAQCFGNIEPIEYMVPYPNLRSLAVGQCIKFSQNILYKDIGITNIVFLQKINQTANWLSQKQIRKGDRVFVTNVSSPMMEILSYAIWSLGAVLVIINDDNLSIKKTNSKVIIDGISEHDQTEIDNQSNEFTVLHNSLLHDNAVIYYNKDTGIILNQYNLLINAYGVQKHINILSKNVLCINVPPNSTAGIVLKTILPLYAGASLTDNNADITFGVNSDADYQLKFEWKQLEDTIPQSLYILPEATAILAIGSTPNHLVAINNENGKYKINGHSIMVGYTDNAENSKIFLSGSLIIQR